MQYKLFTIPAIGDENSFLTNELNIFLRSNRILSVTKHLIANNDTTLWCFCVEYLEGAKPASENESLKYSRKVDYKEMLSEDEFSRFRILRECRKHLAEEAGVPAYAIFIDAQLAELSKQELESISAEKLKNINGFGEKKLEKFGQRFLTLLKENTFNNEIKDNKQ